MSTTARCLRTRAGLSGCSSVRATQNPPPRRQWLQRYPITTSAASTSPTSPSSPRTIFSGIQPTGIPHLGNYLGALRQWVKLQDEAGPGDQLIYSIVDLHALTLPQEAEVLREWRRQSFAILLAVGLRAERATVFFQSSGACGVDVDIEYGFLDGVFVEDDAVEAPAKRIMSLKSPDQKMSKSHTDPNSRILLTDDPETIHKKIKVALTDSEPGISYDPDNRPGVSNLLDILSNFDDTSRLSPAELAQEHKDLSLKSLKEHVAQKVAGHLAPVRERYAELMADERGREYLDCVAREGADKAGRNAEKTMKQVKAAIGL
ncbi:tryptophanyl-tRNA synthetase [Uncinocarpus reesii 1704]|uniref:tryptophan--tRNA ligase n=1 Tax=Uncinocarpus reesii (strain UAMH 1704) TaxID=336963 RepID=C4JPK0_UNCRE|nr:tryptophanyl-tRNA synthetase [Uncinocarpus reesii 1704]EEP78326.1 tryptophanyl-tRNA synthetase [Uncinocarpus reesii 1704]